MRWCRPTTPDDRELIAQAEALAQRLLSDARVLGPVLGLMRAADLSQAIEWQNQPAYGLTAGLQSPTPPLPIDA